MLSRTLPLLGAIVVGACTPAPQPISSTRLLASSASSAPVIASSAPPLPLPSSSSTLDPSIAALFPPTVAGCKGVKELQAREIRDLEKPEEATGFGSELPCIEGTGGAWGVVARDLRWGEVPRPGGDGATDRMIGGWNALVHVDTRGRVLSLRLPHTLADARVRLEAVFDYDGDGIAEAAVMVERTVPLGRATAVNEVDGAMYTAKDGRIATYRTPVFVGVEDVDKDGRPDLLVLGPYGGHVSVAGSFASMTGSEAALYLAHSRPGGSFSLDDSVSRGFQRQRCGDDGKKQLAAFERSTSPYEQFRFVACARILGVSAKDVLAAVARVCKSDDCSGAQNDLEHWAAADPQVRAP